MPNIITLHAAAEGAPVPLTLTIALACLWPLLPGPRPALLPEPPTLHQNLPYPDGVT